MAANSTDTRNSTLMPSTATKTTFLVIFLLIGLFGNIFLIITVGSNRKLRSTAIHIVSLNFAVTNLLNCLLNFSFAIGYTVSPAEDLDSYLCRTNAFFMSLVTVETPLTLILFSLDRFIYSMHPEKYVSFQNSPRTFFFVLYTWIHALAFSIPLVAGLITIEIHKNLSVCLPSVNINTVYLTFYTLFCFILPLCAMIIFFIFIIKAACTQQDRIHSMMAQHHYSKDSNNDRIQYLNEVCATKLVGFLCLTWVVCEMPFISAYIVRLTFSNIYYSPNANVTLLWLKFSYVMALPLLAFTINKDIWQSFKDRIFCRKRNSVIDATNTEYSPETTKDCLSDNLKIKVKLGDEKKVIKEENAKETYVRTTGFQVPVFFATSNGVHIHTLNDDESLSENDDVYDNPNVMKCDVLGSQDFLNQCDTSDYDSSNELDPFSVSHPVTSKTLKDSDETLQRRSNSHPEVRIKSDDTGMMSGTISSAADSGVDISTSRTAVLTSTINTSKTTLITHEEMPETNQHSGIFEHDKKLNIPGEIKEQSSTNNNNKSVLHTQNEYEIVPCSNSCISDADNNITTSSEISKIKKKKKRKDRSVKPETSELSHTSSGILDIKPAMRLQPLPNSPVRPANEGGTFNNKLSVDLLSDQQLCDTSKSVVTPSACYLVSDELVNCVTTNECK